VSRQNAKRTTAPLGGKYEQRKKIQTQKDRIKKGRGKNRTEQLPWGQAGEKGASVLKKVKILGK